MKKLVVRVKPGSKKGNAVQASLDGELLVYVREPAQGGKANRAVVEILAKYYGVTKTHVHLTSGHKSRLKHFEIQTDKE